MAVPFSAVLEYLSAELLELSGNHSRVRRQERVTINIADIEECLRQDDELHATFETFSARDAIPISKLDDSDSKEILQSEVVAQFVFRATESSLLGPCVSYLETFLVEAVCACASQTLSPTKVKYLIKQLTSLYSSKAHGGTTARGLAKKSRGDGAVVGADDDEKVAKVKLGKDKGSVKTLPSTLVASGASSVSFVEEPPKTFVHQHKNCNPESVSVMISVLQLVSLCGAEAVIPLAADRGLTHLCLRLSPFVHGVYEISDSRR